MAKVNSSEVGDLKDNSASGVQRAKGPFLSVSICGKPRKGQTVGTMQCLKPGKTFDSPEADRFLFSEKKQVCFITMFMRRLRCKYERLAGKDYDSLTYFCWNPSDKESFPAGAKIEWVFAGILMDDNYKPVMDPVETDRAAFIYFRNKGSKCGKAFDFINVLEKKTGELIPLSDNPDTEKYIVTPRRFVTKASVGIYQHPTYGGQYIFEYSLDKQLPDDTAVDIIKKSQKWLPSFESQFNLTNFVKAGGSVAVDEEESQPQEDPNNKIGNPTFKDSETADKDKIKNEVAKDFELPGI